MEETNEQGMDEYFHCEDCDLTIHENDKGSHLSGGRHRYRIRRKEAEEENNAAPKYRCEVCDTTFTDDLFYTCHKGSKTHKRNLKRILKNKKGLKDVKRKSILENIGFDVKPMGRSVPFKAIDPAFYIKEGSDYKSIREKYRPRNTKNPAGNNRDYICSVTAYWAVSLALEPHVKDFKICINDKQWGDFGDVVVEMDLNQTTEQPALSTIFAIQFKNVSDNLKSIESFNDGRFGLAKYLTQMNSVKIPKEAEKEKFIIYTTAPADPNVQKQIRLKTDLVHRLNPNCECKEKEVCIVAKGLSNRRKLLINTSDDNDNIFFFFPTDNIHNLPKIYLYTHQKKQKHFGVWIDEIVSRSIYGDRKVNIHREFIKYIEYWSEGVLGGNYKLKKEDILVKLGHLLLYSYKIPPVVRAMEKQNYGIWQHAMHSVDVVILKKHPVIVSKICEPINLRIETELDLKIDSTTGSIDLSQNIIKKIKNPVLKMYLFEETMGDIQDDIPLDIVYDFFWKAGLVPLGLEVEDLKEQEHVLSVITMLKSLGLTRRYFVMTSDINIKNSLRYYKTLTFFVNVDDISRKIPPHLLDFVKINVTDQFSLSLKTIQNSDKFFQKSVSSHEFFDMSLGKYSFKSFRNNLAKKGGQNTQLVLDDDNMNKLKEAIDSKDEMKMFTRQPGEEMLFLRGVKPNLFS